MPASTAVHVQQFARPLAFIVTIPGLLSKPFNAGLRLIFWPCWNQMLFWYCGECLSCKTRCPRNNTPGYVVQALRNLSQENGYFTKSEKGRQQLKVKRIVGETMIRYGYCVFLDEIDLEGHPEQGPVWQWYKDNAESILKRLGANYKGDGKGTMRRISDEDLKELHRIFEVTGAIKRFEDMEKYVDDVAIQKID